MGKKITSIRELRKVIYARYGSIAYSTEGNKFYPLITPGKIYKEFYSAMSNAKKSINVEFFIFEADKMGKDFTNLLCKKAKEGLAVNVILDFFGSYPWAERRKLYNKMTSAGVNLRFSLGPIDILRSMLVKDAYGPRHLYWPRLFFGRNHRKILVVDGETAYTGGANIGKQYINYNKRYKKAWRDFQFKIKGPAVNAIQLEFFRTWMEDEGSVDLSNLNLYFRRQSSLKEGILLNVITNSFGRFHKLLDPLLKIIRSSKEYIYIENPYILNEDIIRELILARKRGVIVEIVTSLEELDFDFLKMFIETQLIRLNLAGIKVYIYPKTLLHGKAMLVDDRVAIVGTANLNNRSFYLDYELNLELFDKKTLLRLKKIIFEKDLAISLRFGRKTGKFFSRLKFFLTSALQKIS